MKVTAASHFRYTSNIHSLRKIIINKKTDPELRYQNMLQKVKLRGGRLTSHRLALLRLISVSEGHPNATELFEQMRTQFPTISLATVYKTLTLLKEEGEVLEIDLRDESRYDGNKPYPHPHLICQHCGKIIDGDDVTSTAALNQEIQKRYGFQVDHANMVFYGICDSCQRA
jgi:Fur family peroxide stress response transcriptional regulator